MTRSGVPASTVNSTDGSGNQLIDSARLSTVVLSGTALYMTDQ